MADIATIMKSILDNISGVLEIHGGQCAIPQSIVGEGDKRKICK